MEAKKLKGLYIVHIQIRSSKWKLNEWDKASGVGKFLRMGPKGGGEGRERQSRF